MQRRRTQAKSNHPSRGAASALGRLISPVTVEEFLASYFECKPLFVDRNDPDYFKDLLTLSDVDTVLTVLHPRSGQIDLVNASAEQPIKKSEYMTPTGFADAARVAELFAAGATVVFPQLHFSLPKLAELCAGLEAEFTHPFQTNVYLTPPGSQGFGTHYDTHDVFVVQVAGCKKWDIYGTPLELPLHTQSFVPSTVDPGPVTRSIAIEPGDVLYIPRGVMHQARSARESCLHITVGVLTYTWADLMMDALTAVCLDDPAFRRSLPAGFARVDFDRTEARAHFGELLKRLKDKADIDNLLDGFADHFIGMREVPLPGQLEAMDPARKLTRRDSFAPRPNLIYRLRQGPEPEQITLRARGIEMTLPSTMEDALRFALEQPRYRADDLPVSLSPGDKLTLAARLLREGLIERVTARTNAHNTGPSARGSDSPPARRRRSVKRM